MAKILTGPLAAGLSGKLGPVVFHQTRFGQVVQSKAKPRIYTTPAAMSAKSYFRQAASMQTHVLQPLNLVAAPTTTRAGKSVLGQFIRSARAWLADGEIVPMPATAIAGYPTFQLANNRPLFYTFDVAALAGHPSAQVEGATWDYDAAADRWLGYAYFNGTGHWRVDRTRGNVPALVWTYTLYNADPLGAGDYYFGLQTWYTVPPGT